MIALAVSNERADAHDGVVDVLRKLVAEGRTNVNVSKRKDWRYLSGRSTDWRAARSLPTPGYDPGGRSSPDMGE
jgi:hypothetical protein